MNEMAYGGYDSDDGEFSNFNDDFDRGWNYDDDDDDHE